MFARGRAKPRRIRLRGGDWLATTAKLSAKFIKPRGLTRGKAGVGKRGSGRSGGSRDFREALERADRDAALNILRANSSLAEPVFNLSQQIESRSNANIAVEIRPDCKAKLAKQKRKLRKLPERSGPAQNLSTGRKIKRKILPILFQSFPAQNLFSSQTEQKKAGWDYLCEVLVRSDPILRSCKLFILCCQICVVPLSCLMILVSILFSASVHSNSLSRITPA